MADLTQDNTGSRNWCDEVSTSLHLIMKHITDERNKLLQDQESFAKEKLIWETSKRHLETSQHGDRIILDVSGTKFACSIETLTKIPDTYFSALVSGRWDLKQQKDNSIFIEREPIVFHHIMTYLRKFGTNFDLHLWVCSISKAEQALLLEEAKFFLLDDLVKRLQSFGVIFDPEAWLDLNKVIDVSHRELIYQGTVHGFNRASLKPRCTKKSPTIVLFKLSFGAVIGGYTSIPWVLDGGYQHDPTAFLLYHAVGGHLQTLPLDQPGHTSHSSTSSYFAFGGNHCVQISLTGTGAMLCLDKSELGHLGIGKEVSASEFEIWHLHKPSSGNAENQ